jgi:hypothetical protein
MSSKRKGSGRQAPIAWAAVLQNPATPKPDPAGDEQRTIDAICQVTHQDPAEVREMLGLFTEAVVQSLLEGKDVELGDLGSLSLVPCSPDEASGVDNAGDEEDEIIEGADHLLYRLHFESGEVNHKITEAFISRLARRN